MKKQISKIGIYIKISIGLLLVFNIIMLNTSCKKINYLENPVGIAYLDNKAYIINDQQATFSLSKYDSVEKVFDEYLIVKKNNKYGYILNTGKEIIKPKYEVAYPMKENKAVVKEKGTYYIIDNTGKKLYTFENGLISYSYFKENKLIIEKNGLLGFLEYNIENNTFSVLVDPVFQFVDNFSEGYAGVGELKEDKMKYNFIDKNGDLVSSSFTWDFVESFNCHLARVGILDNNQVLKYQYLKLPTTETPISYLTNSTTNEIIKYDYATQFSNNIAMVANYKYYGSGINTYYKWFSFIDNEGNANYETAISETAKEFPNNFFPSDPFFIDGILHFRCGGNSGKWVIYYFNKYQSSIEGEELAYSYEFLEGKWQLSEDNEFIKAYMNKTNIMYGLAKSYLESPYEMGTIKFNSTLNKPYGMVRVNGNKCGLYTISYVKVVNEKNGKITYEAQLSFITAPLYDNIIY